MTNSRSFKDEVRAYQRDHRVNYTTARRVVEKSGYTPPSPSTRAGFAACDAADRLVDDLLHDHGLELPPGWPDLVDARVIEVSFDSEATASSLHDELDTAELHDGEIIAYVRLSGWLGEDEAEALKKLGRVIDIDLFDDGTASVTVDEWFVALVRVTVLIHDESSWEVQQVIVTWEGQS